MQCLNKPVPNSSKVQNVHRWTFFITDNSVALKRYKYCKHLFLDVKELQHAVSAQQIVSPHPYKKDYRDEIVGKGPQDPTIGYPEHDHHKKIGDLASSVNKQYEAIFYVKVITE